MLVSYASITLCHYHFRDDGRRTFCHYYSARDDAHAHATPRHDGHADVIIFTGHAACAVSRFRPLRHDATTLTLLFRAVPRIAPLHTLLPRHYLIAFAEPRYTSFATDATIRFHTPTKGMAVIAGQGARRQLVG